MGTVEHAKADFGARMRRMREERGVSLRQIADTTKLSVGALEALERNDISRLPGGIFSRGFVRSYAVEVGLDPEQTVREFLAQFPSDSVTLGSPQTRSVDLNNDKPEGRGTGMMIVMVAISLVIAVVIALMLSRP